MVDSQNQPPLPHWKHNPQPKKQKLNTMVPFRPLSSGFNFKGKSDRRTLRDRPWSLQHGNIFFNGKLTLFFILMNITRQAKDQCAGVQKVSFYSYFTCFF